MTPFRVGRTAFPILCSATIVTALSAQSPAPPSVQITSPEAGTYVSGLTFLRAAVDPSAAVSSVTFFVDEGTRCTARRSAARRNDGRASYIGATLWPM